MSWSAEAKLLGRSNRHIGHDVESLAAAVYFAGRGFVSSLLSRLGMAIRSGRLRGVASMRYKLYDETPLTFSAQQAFREPWSRVDIAPTHSESAPVEETTGTERQAKQVVKVFQTELWFGWLLSDARTGQLLWLTAPVPCCLTFADHATGPAIRALVAEQCFLPLYEPTASLFDFRLEISTIDSCGANLVAEASAARETPDAFMLVLTCQIHQLSNIQGRCFLPIAPLVSGVISVSLAQRPAGATSKLRTALATVLERSVRHYPSPPPAATDSRTQYRDAVFQACLPTGSALERRRAARLRELLNGDLCSETIDWHEEDPRRSLSLPAWAKDRIHR